MLKTFFYFVLVLGVFPLLLSAQQLFGDDVKKIEKWAVSYNSTVPVSNYASYDIVAVDSTYPIEGVKALKAQGKTVFGYVNMGEIDSFSPYYNLFKDEYVAINPFWTYGTITASCVDPRNGKWPKYMLETVLPDLFKKPFDGVLLDTLDTAMLLEAGWDKYSDVDWKRKKQASELKGMTKTFMQLVQDIKKKFPDKKVFLYRGLEIYDEYEQKTFGITQDEAKTFINAVDYMLLENLIADQNDQGVFVRRAQEDIDQDVERVSIAQGYNRGLKILSLDYWPLDDKAGIKKIYEEQRGRGYTPYVGPLDLMSVIPEPK